MQLTGNFILVKPDTIEEKTASGIYYPDQAKQTQTVNRGTIVLVGPGFPDDPMLAKVGEYIIYQRNSGISENYEGEKHLIMRQSDKIAKLK